MLILNGEVYSGTFSFERKNIRIEDGIFKVLTESPLLPESGEEVFDASGMRIIPGLTDIHFHGCNGSDLCDGSFEALHNIAGYEKRCGIFNICPATMTLKKDRLKEICSVSAQYRKAQGGRSDEARLIGIHLEGPFISKKKPGAQSESHIIRAEEGIIEELLAASNGLIKLITIAPEEEGALSCIEKYRDRVHFSVGHTAASYDEAAEAFDKGADHVTHLFNAMPPLLHREPGVIGAAFEREGVFAELICDGVHVHPAAIRAAFKLFTAKRIVLISDSMRACGMPDGEYELGGIPVIKQGRKAVQRDGTLAGSVTNLYDCMTEAVRAGVSAEDAIRAAAYNPLVSIGAEAEYGFIMEGFKAQALIVDEDWRIKRII
ncbi:MAG: N-acetylglucosamine-6-phosphate deacetylase [Lachnospiraceae bacterium]|nr:N-acetylglucosamine-6-phosphate deacetylase [Lachnospiraceae bacterium]